MSRSKLQSKTVALIFSLLIILSSFSAVIPTYEGVDAGETRGEETTLGKGNTQYVDDDAAAGGDGSLEKPYQKIQGAINASEEGDTIQVFNGTYSENVVVNKSVDLIGNGSETTTINGGGSGVVVKITANGVTIRSFTITNNGSSGSGIKVESDHNTISNSNCSYNNYGIWLTSGDNENTLTNNICSNNEVGIYLQFSEYNIVINNTCSENGVGIQLSISKFNTITNNVCSNNYWYGIFLISSNENTLTNNLCSNNLIGIFLSATGYCTITDNTCDNNREGIYLSSSGACTLKNNIMIENGIYISGNNIDTWNSFTIDQTNMVNGKPVYYYKDITGFTVPYGAGQVILANCNWITVENQRFSNGSVGILVGHSSYITLKNNNCSNNNVGISIYASDNNTISNNICSNNGRYGIRLSDNSKHNTITRNNCSYNTIGIYLYDESNENIITRSTISGNGEGIILERSSSNNTIQYSNIVNNRDYGINASNNNGFSVDASNNWWGDASGPFHPVDFPAGKGDNVTDSIESDPWLNEQMFKTIFVAKHGNDTVGNGTNENPFLTIQKAVDKSRDGDYIRVFEGVYEENIIVDKSIEIIGNGSGETVIDGMGNVNPDNKYPINCNLKGDFGGHYNDVAFNEEYLYVANNEGISIFNVSDPSNPEEISLFPLDSARSVVVSGNFAYVAAHGEGLIIMNVSDPANPTEEGHPDTPSSARGVAVNGNYAYVTDWSTGLYIINIINQRNPTMMGHFEMAYQIQDVSVSGDYAYIATISSGLVVVNMSDPGNPSEEGSIDADHSLGIAVNGGYAYLTDYDTGLVTINVTDPRNPTNASSYETEGYAKDVVIVEDIAYVADEDGYLVIVDISDPLNPTGKANFSIPGPARAVTVNDGLAIIAGYGFSIVNVSDPVDPKEEGRYETLGDTQAVEVKGDYAFIADGSNGFMILDISDLEKPQETGHFKTGGGVYGGRDVAVSGDYAYIADNKNGLVIVNISDLENPTEEVNFNPGGNTNDVVIRDNYAYVPSSSKRLAIVNISDPENPVEIGSIDTAGIPFGLTVSGDFAYICDGGNFGEGLVIVNISNPENPIKVGSYLMPYWPRDVAVSGNYAFVVANNGGFNVVDISNPENPTEETHIDISNAWDIVVNNDYAYVVDQLYGLVIVNISDPSNPIEEGYYNTAGYPLGVAVSGDYAYVADDSNGLAIVEMSFPTTAVQITAPHTILSSLTIRNGSRTGVLIDVDNVGMYNCELTQNWDAIKIINGSESVEIRNCDIIENTGWGINTLDNNDKIVNALNSWWGDPSGPSHPTLNPEGMGGEVSDNVDFEPWLDLPIDFRIHHVAIDGNDISGNGDPDNPLGSIQKAIDLANDWDTIEVAPGTYSESITINKRNITILGNSPTTTIIDAGGADMVGEITADDVELNGFTILNATENGILIADSSGVKIVNCAFPENSYDLNLTNSQNIQIINTTYDTVNFNDAHSDISVLWPIDLKVVDNRSGFIPNAHLKITDKFEATVFDDYTDDTGYIPQINIIEYHQNLSAQIEYNPYTISIWKNGYLNFTEDLTIKSYSPVTCELQDHILPQAIISGEIIQEVEMDSEIDFDGSASTGRSIIHYWEFGNGEFSSSPTPSHTYNAPGAYQVNLTVTDDYANTSVTSIIVIVDNVIPIARADSDMNSLFEDEAIDFDASDSWDTSSDSLSFLWDFGDGIQSENIMPTHSYEKQGLYDVSLTAIDMYGGESSTHLFITVMNQVPWDVSAGGNRSVFTREIVEFQGSAFDTFSDIDSLVYLWDFGDGMETEGQNVGHTYYESGEYLVNLTVIDNDGATSYSLVTISVKNPKITASVSRTSISQDEEVFFEAAHELDDGSFIYTWYFGDGLSQAWNETYHTYYQSGIFSPYLIIYDGIENISIFLGEIVVKNVIPTPLIEVDELQVNEDESVLFNAINSMDSPSDYRHLTYVWDFNDYTTGVGVNVAHAYHEMGTYTVILTVSDGKTTNTTEVQIEVQNIEPVANAGTPNERKATEGKPVILDASQSQDTDSDLTSLNYTWKIGDDRVYGEIVSYTFEASGSYSVVVVVRDNNGAASQDSITFEVSKSSTSEDEEAMGTISWILLLVIIVFLCVIGFLIHALQDEKLYKEMIAERETSGREIIPGEETIVVEGVVDEDSFKPRDNVPETIVEVSEGLDAEIVNAEREGEREGEREEEADASIFKPPDDRQELASEAADDHEVETQDKKEGVEEVTGKEVENATIVGEPEDTNP